MSLTTEKIESEIQQRGIEELYNLFRNYFTEVSHQSFEDFEDWYKNTVEETLNKKKGLVGDLIHLYINSLTLDELKNQLVENLAGDCEDDQHDYLVDLVEEKFGESVESLHERTDGGRIIR